jgi:O-acetyl-ADP-ribose deacetylase (regulator of RNase III)
MITLKTGDILDTDTQAIAIPVNAIGVAGAGLALVAARRWPYWAESYKAACALGDIEQVGDVELTRNLDAGPEWIISVATKGHWQEKSTLPGVMTGLQNLAIALRDYRIRSLALPALGCGLGGLPWNDVRALIWETLEGSTCDIRVYTPPLRVIVAGSRTIMDYRLVEQAIQESGFTIREIISGGARGVDQLGLRYARGHKIPTTVFPAKWKRDGRAAGFIRNERMAEVAHALIAVWDGVSKGTKHMIDLARKLDLTVHIHQVNSLPGE